MAVERRRWFPDLFEGLMGPEAWPGMDQLRIEQEVEDGAMVIRAEIPGVDPEKDVDISVERGVLTVSAERREEKREEKEGRKRSEFRYGSLRRSVSLPENADEENITATCKDGVLEVRVPTTEEPSPGAKKIQIEKG